MRLLSTLVLALLFGVILSGAVLAALLSGRMSAAPVLAYVAREDGTWLLTVNDPQAEKIVTYDVGNIYDCGLSWSPDGDTLVYSSTEDYANADVWSLAVFAQASNRLTFNDNLDAGTFRRAARAVWSPAGDMVAYETYTGDTTHLNLVAADGDGTRLLQTIDGSRVNKLQWSPDGRYIAASTTTIDAIADYTILVIDVERSAIVHRIKGRGAVWSADGAALAYYRQENGTNIMRLHIASSQITPLTYNGLGAASHEPVWARDGVVYHLDQRVRNQITIRRLNPGTGGYQTLDLPPFTDIYDLTVSPDGKYLAFEARNALDADNSYVSDTPYTLYMLATANGDLDPIALFESGGDVCGLTWRP